MYLLHSKRAEDKNRIQHTTQLIKTDPTQGATPHSSSSGVIGASARFLEASKTEERGRGKGAISPLRHNFLGHLIERRLIHVLKVGEIEHALWTPR